MAVKSYSSISTQKNISAKINNVATTTSLLYKFTACMGRIFVSTKTTNMYATKTNTATTEAPSLRAYQGGFFNVLIAPEQTGGSLALIDMTLPKGSEPPPHFHTMEDETFYLLEGRMEFQIGSEAIEAVQGAAVFAPRQVPHHFTIQSQTARFLTVITPGSFLEYFMEASFPTAAPEVTPPQGPPPAEAIETMVRQLTQKYGILFI